ncbi:TlpA disulfide reductase family protein [Oceanobacillus massiliensis]|uniref:TlpA disulfide reductase family protein n=1 Tax=Oceanobacillus massiliensis TaxID=1465765 RepID=UPI00028A3A94|nr:TlpA disulfide reductase family protein [Oceanobacillus massiliensis]
MKLSDDIPELEAAGEWINSRRMINSDLIGEKPTLIYFWSVSCSSCKRALPLINQVRDEYKGKLHVLSIHRPLQEEDKQLQTVRDQALKYQITDPLFADQEDILSKRFQAKYVPAYFIFDANGKLKHFQSGGNGLQLLRRRLERVMK